MCVGVNLDEYRKRAVDPSVELLNRTDKSGSEIDFAATCNTSPALVPRLKHPDNASFGLLLFLRQTRRELNGSP